MHRYAVFMLLLLTGCMSLGSDTHHIYVLADNTATVLPAHTPVPLSLRIETTRSTSYDDNRDLVFARTPDTRGHYQYAQWSELPSTRMSSLIFNRIVNNDLYRTVLNAAGEGYADRHLATELLACYHDTAQPPGQAVIRLRAELYDHQQLIARRTFTRHAPVKQFDGAGAATAFNQAESGLLDDLAQWLMTVDRH